MTSLTNFVITTVVDMVPASVGSNLKIDFQIKTVCVCILWIGKHANPLGEYRLNKWEEWLGKLNGLAWFL